MCSAPYSIDLVQRRPLLVRSSQRLGRLDAAAQLTGPDLQVLQLLLLHKLGQDGGELQREDNTNIISWSF